MSKNEKSDPANKFQPLMLLQGLEGAQRHIHATAKSKGWWGEDGKADRNNGEAIALMHSELSEALEALRHGNPPDDKIQGFSGAEAELRLRPVLERWAECVRGGQAGGARAKRAPKRAQSAALACAARSADLGTICKPCLSTGVPDD